MTPRISSMTRSPAGLLNAPPSSVQKKTPPSSSALRMLPSVRSRRKREMATLADIMRISCLSRSQFRRDFRRGVLVGQRRDFRVAAVHFRDGGEVRRLLVRGRGVRFLAAHVVGAGEQRVGVAGAVAELLLEQRERLVEMVDRLRRV